MTLRADIERNDPQSQDSGTSDMVRIPGGTFRMGSDHHYPEEAPVHRVTVEGFWIDRTPVTNRQFRRFVDATGHKTYAEIPPDPSDEFRHVVEQARARKDFIRRHGDQWTKAVQPTRREHAVFRNHTLRDRVGECRGQLSHYRRRSILSALRRSRSSSTTGGRWLA